MKIESAAIESLVPYALNSRDHGQLQVDRIATSISEFGFNQPIVVDEQNIILVGHGRLEAAKKLGLKEVPVLKKTDLSEAQKKAYRILDNKLQNDSTWNFDSLELELQALIEDDFDLQTYGLDELEKLFEQPIDEKERAGKLSADFLVAPFSVVSARDGWWQERKRYWIGKGIKSEEGRDEELLGKESEKSAYGKVFLGKDPKTGELKYADGVGKTSVFDPVLCELVYRWFSAETQTVRDPFAGGSVRGAVAAMLNRRYIGRDLRGEQVEANRAQWLNIVAQDSDLLPVEGLPLWDTGDSRHIDEDFADLQADLLFSCPPYADLEQYSDDPNDLSNMDYEDFLSAYHEIIEKSCRLLKNDRFACFVVGDIRDKAGNYRNFVSDTIAGFLNAGLNLYNEAILVTPIGTRFLFAGGTFAKSRKLAKTHQNILVFLKGDARKAVEACGQTVFAEAPNDGSEYS